MTHLKEGDPAPDFSAVNEDGKTVRLSDFRGKKLALYFYPQDNTPTCTKEACNLRDGYADLRDKGFEILGVSPDSAKRHTNFRQKFNLPFSLLADTDRKIVNDYGVWGPKKFMGMNIVSVHRTTFIIDEKGIIERIITNVVSGKHAQQILEEMEV
ncbi:MAG: thioredoxin-dependent thiol peroxidase [Anaerolineae bacterium]|nr:thioredoxin-dependent thiol peroxidase [Anaerolineae bacterium]MCB0606471.1 thioredoxin-dependent thiol peroxidase [Lewinella sp.]MCB9277813.1 thioredoxin-dependent thiol peroxidase [Lewinellaceae bacterium]